MSVHCSRHVGGEAKRGCRVRSGGGGGGGVASPHGKGPFPRPEKSPPFRRHTRKQFTRLHLVWSTGRCPVCSFVQTDQTCVLFPVVDRVRSSNFVCAVNESQNQR